jgi:AmmeMemoRadiSam system protein B
LISDRRTPDADVTVDAFLAEVVQAVAGRRTLWVAGADLAHVGPRFGDQEPLTAEDRESLERRDQATLDACARGDARGWFQEISREEDRRRVCGLSPIYALLHAAQPGAGRLAAYGQCPADENGGSLVSIASVVWA